MTIKKMIGIFGLAGLLLAGRTLAAESPLNNGTLALTSAREEASEVVAELISRGGANANNVQVILALRQSDAVVAQDVTAAIDIVHERPTIFKIKRPAGLSGAYALEVAVVNNADRLENKRFSVGLGESPSAVEPQAATPVPAESTPVGVWGLNVTLPAGGQAGAALTLSAQARSPRAISNGLIDLEVYDEQGAKVFQAFKSDQAWAAGETRDLTTMWVPKRAGNYQVKLGLFADGWSKTLAWNDSAGTLAVKAADELVGPVAPPALEPLSTSQFYVDPNNDAKKQADAWRQSRPADATLMDKMAGVATARWLGDWNANVEQDTRSTVLAAKKTGTVPVFVLYNIPQRDCGNYSAGGANNPDGYRAWIESFVRGLSGQALVVLEPDALTLTDCLSDADRLTRFDLIKFAAEKIKAAGARVYLDAGHSNWIAAGEMANRLNAAGIALADGFALNTSNFRSTEENTRYGEEISRGTGGKHFIIDTSRNGNGSNGGEWCNPSGRALGTPTTTKTGNSLVDALIWLKPPGQSDGSCNGGPAAGTWWPEYALDLARRAKF